MAENLSQYFNSKEEKVETEKKQQEEKIRVIVDCLKNGKDINYENLSFLDSRFGFDFNINDLGELYKFLNIDFDENDLDLQRCYFDKLHKIVDGIIEIKYLNDKFSFEYPNIVVLNEAIVKTFNFVTKNNDIKVLEEFIDNLLMFCDGKLKNSNKERRKFIQKNIYYFYDYFLKNGAVGLFLTDEFCNRILNEHRNSYFSVKKEKIFKSLEVSMRLSGNVKDSVLRRLKIKKVLNIIKNREFSENEISESKYNMAVDQIKMQILSSNLVYESKIFGNNLDAIYVLFSVFCGYGYINEDMIYILLQLNDDDILSEEDKKLPKEELELRRKFLLKLRHDAVGYVIKKIESLKVILMNDINLNDSGISLVEKTKQGNLNYRGYLIADRERVYENIAKVFLCIDNDSLKKILNNKEKLQEILFLINFVDLIPEFDVNTFVNILVNYDRIISRMFSDNDNYQDKLLSNIDRLINYANAYGSIDDITMFALGNNISSELGDNHFKAYLEVYLKMCDKTYCDIPSVSFSTKDFKFESGFYSDPERLLIGKKTKAVSCIDLFEAGVATYNEVLCKSSGDVILIRDLDDNLVSRILLFRRGNVIQMVTQVVDNYSIEIFKEVADQILDSAIARADNIDYVFVNSAAYNISKLRVNGDKYLVVTDSRFVDNFPHADFTDSAILLSARGISEIKKKSDLKLNFDVPPSEKYVSKRKDVCYSPLEDDITRLRALNVVMESDSVSKENKARNFERFSMNNYKSVVCGEDWYIALKNDGEFEEVRLPFEDKRNCVEFYEMRDKMREINDSYIKSKGVKK